MTSLDQFLNGKIQLHQPVKGYRAGIDAVLLASIVNPCKNDRVLDVGAGVGAVMLCLAHRHPEAIISGLEIQPEMVELNQKNIILNHKSKHVSILQGNILNPPEVLPPNSFDHVVSNPPYFDYGLTAQSIARHESEIDLVTWISACVRMVKPRGYLTLIHRADRLDEILCALKKKAGGIKIYPLWPSVTEPAKLVIVQARKSVKTPCELLPGLVLHQDNKDYTPQAESVFRGESGLCF